MSSWFARRRRRQLEIQQGADADLFETNRKRWTAGFWLAGTALALMLLVAKLHLPSAIRTVLGWLAFVAFLIALVLNRWALLVDGFLKRPDREGPPSIFKE
jgi:hypothetical protein